MKLSFISCILLLVPLALAQPAPNAKLLFDNNFVITESFDLRRIEHYFLFKNDHFSFAAHDNSSDYPNSMFLRGDLKGESFAIESYYRDQDFDSDKHLCKKNSEKQMSHLISNCFGNVYIRSLTEDERAQLQQYKDEQTSTKPKFEVIYNKKRTITKSAENHSFYYLDKVGQDNNHSLLVHSRREHNDLLNKVIVEGKLSGRSFVIEGLGAEITEEECGKPGVSDLQVVDCVGKIAMRPN